MAVCGRREHDGAIWDESGTGLPSFTSRSGDGILRAAIMATSARLQ
jgi:hypothetical protein